MYVSLRNSGNNKGFSLIELMIVLAILSLIAALAVPVYLGFRDRARIRTFVADGKIAIPEIYSWMQSSNSYKRNMREVDTNCDGTIDSKDMTNEELSGAGVAKTFIECRNNVFKDRSPWTAQLPLWTINPEVPPGQITLIEEPRRIRLIGKNIGGEVVFQDDVKLF